MKKLATFLYSLWAILLTPRSWCKFDVASTGNVYSAQYTNAYGNSPAAKLTPADMGGKRRVLIASYTQGASAGTIGDVIYMGKLPAGATVLSGKLQWGTGTASEALAVGIVGTPAKFLAATAATTASTTPTAVQAHQAGGATYKTTAETDIIITNSVAAIAAAQLITLELDFIID